MNLEFLIVGIAKGNEKDFKEYYERTREAVYVFALAYLKDRFLAKEAAIESYRRIKAKAYKFDTDLSAEFWHLDILKNICLNGLCDGEISKKSSLNRVDNVAILLSKALFETDEDRGKIIALRCGSGLSKAQIANLLWYQQGSCNAEFPRGVKQAAELSELEFQNTKAAAERISQDIKEACPDYFDAISDETIVTSFANISDTDLYISESDKALPGESQDARKLRVAEKKREKTKKNTIIAIIIVSVLVIAAAVTAAVLVKKSISETTTEEGEYDIEEPLYNASVSVISHNGKIYYGNYKDGGKLYVYDIATEKSSKLSDATPKDFEKAGNVIYFRNTYNGKISKIDTETLEVTDMGVKGALPIYTEEGIIYSSSNGVSILGNDGEVTEIFNDTTAKAFRYCMDMLSDGSIVFSAAPTDGLYMLSKQEDGTYYCGTTYSGVVIYDFKIVNGYLLYENGFGTLYAVNIDASGKNIGELNGKLLSGAFTVDGTDIYFYGTSGDDAKEGVYIISLESLLSGDEATCILEIENTKNSVSDIYVEENNLLVYKSNGSSKDKAYNELDLYTLNEEKTEATNKKKIFVNK